MVRRNITQYRDDWERIMRDYDIDVNKLETENDLYKELDRIDYAGTMPEDFKRSIVKVATPEIQESKEKIAKQLQKKKLPRRKIQTLRTRFVVPDKGTSVVVGREIYVTSRGKESFRYRSLASGRFIKRPEGIETDE